jgi:hypothetical protein
MLNPSPKFEKFSMVAAEPAVGRPAPDMLKISPPSEKFLMTASEPYAAHTLPC